tara:strand:- start:637 stop:906 length:270 start_codon:yes stop_codon:yes gene_type:complete
MSSLGKGLSILVGAYALGVGMNFTINCAEFHARYLLSFNRVPVVDVEKDLDEYRDSNLGYKVVYFGDYLYFRMMQGDKEKSEDLKHILE